MRPIKIFFSIVRAPAEREGRSCAEEGRESCCSPNDLLSTGGTRGDTGAGGHPVTPPAPTRRDMAGHAGVVWGMGCRGRRRDVRVCGGSVIRVRGRCGVPYMHMAGLGVIHVHGGFGVSYVYMAGLGCHTWGWCGFGYRVPAHCMFVGVTCPILTCLGCYMPGHYMFGMSPAQTLRVLGIACLFLVCSGYCMFKVSRVLPSRV